MKAIQVINPAKNRSNSHQPGRSVFEMQKDLQGFQNLGGLCQSNYIKTRLLLKFETTVVNSADLHQRAGKYLPPEGTSDIRGLEMACTILFIIPF